MYNIVKTKPLGALAKETPALILSAILAELFYKLGSFSIELIAFFATWYAISRLMNFITSKK